LEELVASIFRVEDGDGGFLQNVGNASTSGVLLGSGEI
jgi:hypothetical protein